MINYSLIDFSVSDLCSLIKLETIRLGWTRRDMQNFCSVLTGKVDAASYSKTDWIKCVRILDLIDRSVGVAQWCSRYASFRRF